MRIDTVGADDDIGLDLRPAVESRDRDCRLRLATPAQRTPRLTRGRGVDCRTADAGRRDAPSGTAHRTARCRALSSARGSADAVIVLGERRKASRARLAQAAATCSRMPSAQHLHGIRAQLNPGADFAELRGALIQHRFDAALAQRICRRQARRAPRRSPPLEVSAPPIVPAVSCRQPTSICGRCPMASI